MRERSRGSRAQILNGGKVYDLAAFDAKGKPLVGKRETVRGSLDKDTNTITIESAPAAR